MKQSISHADHAIFTLEIARDETDYQSVDAICAYFRDRIEGHKTATFVAEYDHFAHTKSLPEGHLGEGLKAAKNIVFCYGIALPTPDLLAVRPRSIGVAETEEGFFITFMEAPMPVVNAAMEDWALGLCQCGQAVLQRDGQPDHSSARSTRCALP